MDQVATLLAPVANTSPASPCNALAVPHQEPGTELAALPLSTVSRCTAQADLNAARCSHACNATEHGGCADPVQRTIATRPSWPQQLHRGKGRAPYRQ
ncbi:hypothetical protein E2562_025844 [Oryza meyeriana var. granulata]|uniref:Uncharacterized protein n=1 Tax=Oryza meyeriana var. granulata TaxID=110450 RepID=A0A6G1E462_9ORYZ|nr:hypothetical protein E2562_025844 [Oryza meyeriana var. granulata]